VLPRPSRSALLWLACTCAAAGVVAGPSAAALIRASSARPVRLGAAPSLPPGSRIVGSVASATPMRLTVTLRPRNPAALQAYATAVSTRGSPLYRQYLTPAQFARRFGPTSRQLQAVESSLRTHGLRPGTPSASRLSIPVIATTAAVARAFEVRFAHVELRTGQAATVNRQAPAVDAAVAPDVQAVLGLSTLSRARPLLVRPPAASAASAAAATPRERAHVATGGPQPCAPASQAAAAKGGYTADQIASAYGLSGLYSAGGPGGGPDQGAGQTVAVLELEPYESADIAAYQACYGTAAHVSNVAVDGGAGSGVGSGEAALDIENVIGLAPQAGVIVYEGPNSGSGPYDTFSAIINQRAAQVVTASWGQCEPLNGFSQAQAENTLFEQAAIEGMSIVSASGDDGAEDCFPQSPNPAVDDPASQPYVTGVGGTHIAGIGPRPSESVWNDGPSVGAGGGGVSSFWTMPAYQADAAASLHVINPGSSASTCAASSGDCREVPDVSANADPATGYVIYWNGDGSAGATATQGWQVVGGTSGAAPAWAALFALANASSACNGVPIGFANPALYYAASTNYAADFNDVTTGNNDMTGTNLGQFAAGSGYDMATGLGSPNGTALAASLCADAIALSNPGAQHSVVGRPVSVQIHGFDTHGAPLSFSATGLPAGLFINSSGTVNGRPRHIGTSVVTVSASDQAGTMGHTTFAWTIQGNPTLSRVSLSSVGSARPTLSFTVTAGRGAPQMRTLDVTLPRGLRFTASGARVTVSGRRVKHLRFSASLQHGTLVLKLRTAAQQVRVTISYPRLRAGGGLVSQLARHHSTRVTVTVRVTDTRNLTTKLASRLRPRS
jgi:subtilase family serine protease